jgi:HK97 family phage major capsid protein
MTKFDIQGLRNRKVEIVEKANALIDAMEKKGTASTAKEEAEFKALEIELREVNGRIASVEAAMDREREITGEDRTLARREDSGRQAQKTGKFASFGEFLAAVVSDGRGGTADPRLFGAASGLNEAVPAEGGFLVPQEYAMEILQTAHDMGQILARVRRRTITVGNGVKQNAVDEASRVAGSRWGGVRAYWMSEAGALTATMPKFRQIDLRLEKCAALYYATQEELDDSEGLSGVLTQAFAEELTFTVEDAIWRGDGAGKPLGVYGAGFAALVSVAKETSQAAATLKTQNVLKMWSRLPARSKMNAAWFINVDVEPQLFQFVYEVKNVAGTDNVGGIAAPIFQPAGTGGSPFGLLLGRPVIPVEYAETLGTKGDILLADFSQYLLIEKGMRSDSSLHVRFLNDEQTFRVIWRVNGQPIWSKTLTPYKGANTQSPFVTLDARP